MTTAAEQPLRVLFLGAAYATVLGMRIAAAGHRVTFACREQEAALINKQQLFLQLPAREHGQTIEISAAQCPTPPTACLPDDADPREFDLVCLAMQEPQYSSSEVRDLVLRLGRARTPCLSLMNMPLPPFLSKITRFDTPTADSLFTEAGLWTQFDPAVFTMASADPQAMQVVTDNALTTTVTLPTNFKVAPFEHAADQLILQTLARDTDACRIDTPDGALQPRVRLRPNPSLYTPLAKWPMLITGNFRCLTDDVPRSIAEAVASDLAESRQLYEWVARVCLALGAESTTLVPFDRYLAAARGLSLPSSLARGLHAGATAVERVDKLILTLAGRLGMNHPVLDSISADVCARLQKNRQPG